MTDLTKKQIAEYADDERTKTAFDAALERAVRHIQDGGSMYISVTDSITLHAHALHLRDRAEIERLEAENAAIKKNAEVVCQQLADCRKKYAKLALQEGSE